MAHLIFFYSDSSHILASQAKFYPFYPPKFAKDIDFSHLYIDWLILGRFHRTKQGFIDTVVLCLTFDNKMAN